MLDLSLGVQLLQPYRLHEERTMLGGLSTDVIIIGVFLLAAVVFIIWANRY
jgi:hypothetical protein